MLASQGVVYRFGVIHYTKYIIMPHIKNGRVPLMGKSLEIICLDFSASLQILRINTSISTAAVSQSIIQYMIHGIMVHVITT